MPRRHWITSIAWRFHYNFIVTQYETLVQSFTSSYAVKQQSNYKLSSTPLSSPK